MNNKHPIILDVETRFKTTMIGALARFEESFGHLWEDPWTDQEEYADLWEYTRNAILNNGNKQMRAATEDLSKILFSQYQTKQTYRFNNRNTGDR